MSRQPEKTKLPAEKKTQAEALPQQDVGSPADKGKRKLIVGSLGAAPFLYTLSSRPVMAGNCTISGFYSADLSGRHDCDGYGRSPGYWKNHPEAWPQPLVACGNFKNDKYNQNLINQADSPCTLFHDFFERGVGEPWPADETMLNVLYQYETYAAYHAIAALCNAYAFPGYSLTPKYVVDLYEQYVNTGDPTREDLRAFFDSTWQFEFSEW